MRNNNRSWAKGTNNTQGYNEGAIREAAKLLRLTADRFLNARATSAELSREAIYWLDAVEVKHTYLAAQAARLDVPTEPRR